MKSTTASAASRLVSSLIGIITLTLVSFSGAGQDRVIDSLRSVMPPGDDTIKVNVLVALADRFYALKEADDSCKYYASRARILANKLGFLAGEYRSYKVLSRLFNRRAENNEYLKLNKEWVEMAKQLPDKRLLAMAQSRLASAYRYLNYYNIAFQEASKALDLFMEVGDRKNITATSITIGNIFVNAHEYEKARDYYDQALQYADGDPFRVHEIEMDRGYLYLLQEKYSESLQHVQIALAYFEKEGHDHYAIDLLKMKAEAYLHFGDLVTSRRIFLRALKLAKKLNSLSMQSNAFAGLGETALASRKYDSALHYFNKSLAMSIELNSYKALPKTYSRLADIYLAKGESKKALEAQRMVTVSNDTLHARAQRSKLNELQIQYELTNAERERLRLEDDQQYRQRLFVIVVLLGVSGIVIALLTFIRLKKKRSESETGKHQLNTSLRKKYQIEKDLKKQLEEKSRELTDFTLSMIEKKETLELIKGEIENLRARADAEAKQKLNKIVSTINFSEKVDKDWEKFKIHFDQVHQGFLDYLRNNYPNLNANDLRLCALLRLNLNNKQIASAMDIAPDSAKVAKYRIKRKLGLGSNDSLSEFFYKVEGGNNNQVLN